MSLQQGAVSVEHKQSNGLIHFAEGLIGFTEYRDFRLLDNEALRPFSVLQCTDDNRIGFVVVDPRFVIPDYYKRIPATHWRSIGLRDPPGRLAFVVAALSRKPKDSTANFVAPLIVNPRKLIGRQIMLEDRDLSVCAPLFRAFAEAHSY